MWGETTQRLSLHVTLNGGCWGSPFASCNGGRAAPPRAQPVALREKRDLSGHGGRSGDSCQAKSCKGLTLRNNPASQKEAETRAQDKPVAQKPGPASGAAVRGVWSGQGTS